MYRMLLRLADLASSLSLSLFLCRHPLSLYLLLPFLSFLLCLQVGRETESGGADKERGRESKEEEEDPEIAPRTNP